MTKQKYVPAKALDNLYESMACHVFALSGNTGSIINVNNKYMKLGEYLLDVEKTPTEAMRKKILNVVVEAGKKMRISTLELLCDQFNLKLKPRGNASTGSTCLYGLFRFGQMLPEHMWITHGNRIYDTMPGAPIRRNNDVNGCNPPSEYNVLAKNLVFGVELQELTRHQLTVVTSIDDYWQEE